jgi:hypothetical protein
MITVGWGRFVTLPARLLLPPVTEPTLARQSTAALPLRIGWAAGPDTLNPGLSTSLDAFIIS